MENNTLTAIQQSDVFTHTRIINAMAISLSLARILLFLSNFVQHPTDKKFSHVHFGWIAIAFLWIIQFWWDYLFDIKQYKIDVLKYVLDLCYVFGMYFMCAIITPDRINDYDNYDDYFNSRKQWFFGILIFLNLLQSAGEIIVGIRNHDVFGIVYWTVISVVETAVVSIAIRAKTKNMQYGLIFLTMCTVVIGFCID